MGQVVSAKKLRRINFKRAKVVLTGGSFDLLNVGHVRFLKKCKNFGDVLIVGLADDKNVKERKGVFRPIIPQKYRAEVLAALESVDYVFVSRISAYNDKNLKLIKPDIVVIVLEKGKFNKRRKFKKEIESKFPNITVQLLYQSSKTSTTKIIEKILKVHKLPKIS